MDKGGVEVDPSAADKAEVFKNTGNKDYSAGHFERAIESYSKAIETIGESSPKSAPYFSNRSMCYMRTEKYRKRK